MVYVAAAAFVLGVGIITYARIEGPLKMLDPKVLHDSYIDAQPEAGLPGAGPPLRPEGQVPQRIHRPLSGLITVH